MKLIMNYFYSFGVTTWGLIIIIELNVSLVTSGLVSIKKFDPNELWENVTKVTSKIVPIEKGDPREWREYGEKANFEKFNSIYAVTVAEELLRNDGYCSGKCDELESWRQSFIAPFLRYPNSCKGIIHYCWLQAESERRKAAIEEVNKVYRQYPVYYIAQIQEEIRALKIKQDYTGNDCTCVCERMYNDDVDLRGELVDSICYDPVFVDDEYVATGVRFKRHGNIIYLELQQGILSGGRIDPVTLEWKISQKCNSAKKVVYNWTSNNTYSGLEIILEDMTLPENAVVTGIAFGQSLRGRYLNDDGDFTDNTDKIVKESECSGSVPELTTNSSSYLSPLSLVGENNELSKSCENKIIFRGSNEGTDYMQHTVPYIDLQEIVTDQNSPEPLRGIGWYYRSHPGYGGFLALKIFK